MTDFALLRSEVRQAASRTALRSGDREVTEREQFAALYDETFDAVYRYARTLTSDSVVAEDVAAEVYLRAWRQRASYRGEGRPLSWLLSITHNLAITTMRKAGRETVDPEAGKAGVSQAPDPETAAIAAGQRATILAAMQQLTPEQQQVVVLRFFADWSHAEIAEQIGRKESAVRALQYRGLRRLRRVLERVDV